MPTGPKKIAEPTAAELAAAWLVTKREVHLMTTREKTLNRRLQTLAETFGEPDERGHVWLTLPVDVVGWDKEGREERYNALQRQRRVTVLMDEEEALHRLEAAGLVDECSKTSIEVTDVEAAIKALTEAGLLAPGSGITLHTEIDEAAVRGAYFQEKLTQQDYEAIFTERITWALLPNHL